jgi:hypothetical protein
VPFQKAAPGIAVILAGINSALYYFVYTLSLGPHVILEPWLLNQGFHMYSELADNHTPLMPLLLSLGQLVIPDGMRLAKLALAGLIFLSAILTFLAARKLAGSLAGVLAVIFFIAWSQAFGFYKLWHETFLTPLYLLLIILWSPPNEKPDIRRLFGYGIILGISLLVKQQALLLIAGMTCFFLLLGGLNRKKFKVIFTEIFWIGVGSALPVMVYFGYYLIAGGSLLQFWYWAVSFNDAEMGRMLQILPDPSFLAAISPAFLLFIVFLVRLLRKLKGPQSSWGKDAFLVLIFISGLITAYPRFGSFHLQPMLPVLAIISGQILLELPSFLPAFLNKLKKPIFIYLIASVFAFFWIFYGMQWAVNSTAIPRKIYEYSDLPSLADQIHQQIGSTACVYIFPEDEANSNLYYLLKCHPPRLWTFSSYPWFSRDGLPELEIAALQAESPEWVLYFPGRWDVENHNPRLTSFVETHYLKFGQIQSVQGIAWLMKRP